jgi:5-methylcytosine-specific restriction protein A
MISMPRKRRPGASARSSKRVDPFYQSQAWLTLRHAVLRRLRRCSACGATAGPLHVDHVRSRKQHPELALDASNLVVLCQSCHSRKTAIEDGGFGNQRRSGEFTPRIGCDADGEPLVEREHW